MKENTRKRSSSSELGFMHHFIPASNGPDQITLLLLHFRKIPFGKELSHLSRNLANPYTIFWLDQVWNDFYIEHARNGSEMTNYWSYLFSKFWLFGLKRKIM